MDHTGSRGWKCQRSQSLLGLTPNIQGRQINRISGLSNRSLSSSTPLGLVCQSQAPLFLLSLSFLYPFSFLSLSFLSHFLLQAASILSLLKTGLRSTYPHFVPNASHLLFPTSFPPIQLFKSPVSTTQSAIQLPEPQHYTLSTYSIIHDDPIRQVQDDHQTLKTSLLTAQLEGQNP